MITNIEQRGMQTLIFATVRTRMDSRVRWHKEAPAFRGARAMQGPVQGVLLDRVFASTRGSM